MTPLVRFIAPVVTMADDHVDTDILFPARFLLIMERRGLGRYLCYDRRYDRNDVPIHNPFDDGPPKAGILLAGRDFGCGSSREQAVWALDDYGFRCIFAESFGEIFAANCLRNGILAARIGKAELAVLAALVPSTPLSVDLPAQKIGWGEMWFDFTVALAVKERLMSGADEVEHIMRTAGPDLAAFEARQHDAQPWLYKGSAA